MTCVACLKTSCLAERCERCEDQLCLRYDSLIRLIQIHVFQSFPATAMSVMSDDDYVSRWEVFAKGLELLGNPMTDLTFEYL